MEAAFRRKASGYLLKDSAASELTAAIRTAARRRGTMCRRKIAAELPDGWGAKSVRQDAARAGTRVEPARRAKCCSCSPRGSR